MTARDPEPPPRYCPNCGAATTPGRTTCATCGHSLLPPKRQITDHDRLWGRDPNQPPADGGEIIDLYPVTDPLLLSSQATTPFTQTRPFDPVESRAELESDTPLDTAPANARGADPWAAPSGTLSKATSSTIAPAGTAVSVSSTSEREHSGPPGFLLGCLAFLLILAVGALLAWGAVRSVVSNEIEEELSIGITNELRSVERLPVQSSGRMRITEEDVNKELRANAVRYKPIEDVTVAIDSDAVTIRFSVYGIESTYRTGLAVDDGRIVLVDSSLDGAAGRIVNEDEVGAVFEAEVAELLRRSNVEPSEVSLRDGSVVIATTPAA